MVNYVLEKVISIVFPWYLQIHLYHTYFVHSLYCTIFPLESFVSGY